jgi:hypothetical protein
MPRAAMSMIVSGVSPAKIMLRKSSKGRPVKTRQSDTSEPYSRQDRCGCESGQSWSRGRCDLAITRSKCESPKCMHFIASHFIQTGQVQLPLSCFPIPGKAVAAQLRHSMWLHEVIQASDEPNLRRQVCKTGAKEIVRFERPMHSRMAWTRYAL